MFLRNLTFIILIYTVLLCRGFIVVRKSIRESSIFPHWDISLHQSKLEDFKVGTARGKLISTLLKIIRPIGFMLASITAVSASSSSASLSSSSLPSPSSSSSSSLSAFIGLKPSFGHLILTGQVYVHDRWADDELLDRLRQDIEIAKGAGIETLTSFCLL